MGTIGWEDFDEWYVQGTAADAGTTLIRVQLIQGRDTSKPLKAEIGQGHKILCQIASGVFYIPNKGTRCYVAIPDGMQDIPGVPVIIATVEKNPFQQFNQDRVMINFGDEKHIVIRGKSVTIAAPTNEFMMIGSSRAGGSPSILMQDSTGSGLVIQSGAIGMMSSDGAGNSKAVFQMTNAGIEMFEATGASLSVKSGNFIGIAITAKIQAAAVVLGKVPTLLTPVLYGASGPLGVASTSVFVSV